MKNCSVSIVGLGYVGLSTAICFAQGGFSVRGLDVDERKVAAISRGSVPFHEEGLAKMLRSALRKGTFQTGVSYEEAIPATAVTYLAVGTPSAADGSIDLTYIRSAAESVGRQIAKKEGYHFVVVKSTAVPGTTEGVVREALEAGSGKKMGVGFGLSANPEFLREGSAVYDTLHPDAIVLGAADPRSQRFLLSLYRGFYAKLPPVIATTPANAELIKYAVNTFRATQLSFLNALANVCQATPGANVDEVSRGLGTITKADPRYLKAGLGFGGSCLPKDTRALIAHARRTGSNPELLEAALHVNDKQPEVAIEMAKRLAGGLKGKKVAVLGLSFKPKTDDTRESVALRLVKGLVREAAEVSVYDPAAMENAKRELGGTVTYAENAIACIRGSECCILATEWAEFRKITPRQLKQLMKNPVLIDTRRAFDAEELDAAGVVWGAIGLGGKRPR